MASALLVGAFEEELDKKVLLGFFVPASTWPMRSGGRPGWY
jgi:hypothetical protein